MITIRLDDADRIGIATSSTRHGVASARDAIRLALRVRAQLQRVEMCGRKRTRDQQV